LLQIKKNLSFFKKSAIQQILHLYELYPIQTQTYSLKGFTMSAKFFLIKIDEPEKKNFFDKEIVKIGRNDTNDLILKDDSVSGEHAMIIFESGQFFLEDLKSTNGTCCNGTLLKNGQKVPLQDGSEFKLGKIVIRYEAVIKLALFVKKGAEIGKIFPLDPDKKKDIYIGRSAEKSDIFFTSPVISGVHAKIFFENGEFFLQDIGSTNGTFYNGKRLNKENKILIRETDEFSLGYGEGEVVLRIDRQNAFNYRRVGPGTIIIRDSVQMDFWEKFLKKL
jgi:pSer/pThr/pTyr-binding forkhead associated (FHA) protein